VAGTRKELPRFNPGRAGDGGGMKTNLHMGCWHRLEKKKEKRSGKKTGPNCLRAWNRGGVKLAMDEEKETSCEGSPSNG